MSALSKISWSMFFFFVFCVSSSGQDASTAEETNKSSVDGKLISVPKTFYPREAVTHRLSGSVEVRVLIDGGGNVTKATPVTGNTVFHTAARLAAMQAKFTPTLREGKPTIVTAFLRFNFVMFNDWERVGACLWDIGTEHSVMIYGNSPSEINWEGFEKENLEYNELFAPATVEDKANRAKKLLKIISEKLEKWDNVELWYFRLGITTSKLGQASGNDSTMKEFAEQLGELTHLLDSAPEGVPADRVNELRAIVQRALSKQLEHRGATAIFFSLIENYNKKLSRM